MKLGKPVKKSVVDAVRISMRASVRELVEAIVWKAIQMPILNTTEYPVWHAVRRKIRNEA